LRQANFNLGNEKGNYHTSSKSALIDYNINQDSGPGKKDSMEIQKKIYQANFCIGDDKKRELKNAHTTYM